MNLQHHVFSPHPLAAAPPVLKKKVLVLQPGPAPAALLQHCKTPLVLQTEAAVRLEP
jgi:hypothetical protein